MVLVAMECGESWISLESEEDPLLPAQAGLTHRWRKARVAARELLVVATVSRSIPVLVGRSTVLVCARTTAETTVSGVPG